MKKVPDAWIARGCAFASLAFAPAEPDAEMMDGFADRHGWRG